MVTMHIKHPDGPSDIAKLAAELLGTYMLTFTVCLNNTTKSLDNPLAHALGIFAPMSIACVLMVLIYSLGSVSGAHLNPAVTVTCWLQDAITQGEAVKYFVVQFCGAALAGLTAVLLLGSDNTSNATDKHPVGPLNINFLLGAPLVEFLYTFMLCFTVLNVCVAQKTKGNVYYGVAIGFVVIAGGYGGGYVSGGYFNPALVLGVNIMGMSWAGVASSPLYVACHFAGAVVAPVALHIVRPETKLGEAKLYSPVTKFFYTVEAMFDPEDTAEFLGAMFLALSISLNANAMLFDCDQNGDSCIGNPGGSLSVGAALMCMIFAMGDISGGLFNPAVTIAYLGRFHGTGCGVGFEKLQDASTSPKEGLKYFTAQILGAVAGTGLTILIWLAAGYGVPAVGPQRAAINATATGDSQAITYTTGQAFFAETFGTFLYCYVVLCVATTYNALKEYKAFVIGCTFIAGGYAFGPLSGGLLNPAITIADCVVRIQVLSDPITPAAYVGAELLGGALAAVVFRFVTHKHEMEQMEKMAVGNPDEPNPDRGYERIKDIPPPEPDYTRIEDKKTGKDMTG